MALLHELTKVLEVHNQRAREYTTLHEGWKSLVACSIATDQFQQLIESTTGVFNECSKQVWIRRLRFSSLRLSPSLPLYHLDILLLSILLKNTGHCH